MINNISLKGFTSFADNSFSFINGVNVLIGKNGTGKTHILKCLASALQARYEFQTKKTTSKEQFEYILAENITHYFKPDFIGNLVNTNIVSGKSTVSIEVDGKELSFTFSTTSKTTVKIEKDDKWGECQFIYIPPREMFSLFEGFIGLSSKRELSFDQTYINLAHSLALPVLRDVENNPLKPAIELLEKELGFKVLQMNGRFYIETDNGQMEAHLVAEGLRKLASIFYLILIPVSRSELCRDRIESVKQGFKRFIPAHRHSGYFLQIRICDQNLVRKEIASHILVCEQCGNILHIFHNLDQQHKAHRNPNNTL